MCDTNYLCKKCNYKCDTYYDIKRHLNKKKSCPKEYEAFFNSDDQLLVLTLLPYHDHIHMVDNSEIEHLNKSKKMYNNKKKLFEKLDFIDKYKLKKCIYCEEEFTRIIDLRKHFLINCFHKNIKDIEDTKDIKIENNTNIDSSSNINNIDINNSYNTTNNNTTNNITNNNNNNNIFFDIKAHQTPVPFDQDWDVSQIDENIRNKILLSAIMYTSLLEEILKNDVNLNVIIDKENDSGVVYKNDSQQYIQMKLKDIIDISMEKLKKHLVDMNTITDQYYDKEMLKICKCKILTKYNNYVNEDNIQKSVIGVVSDVYDKKKEDALKISKNIKIRDYKILINEDGY